MVTAFILAGGKGTRLSSVTGDVIPKPLVIVGGVPVIERAIKVLIRYGVKRFFISVGHLHEKIEEYLGDGSNFGVKIDYIVEDLPLGSGGALYYVKDIVDDDLIVCPGDVVFDVDFYKMLDFHKSRDALITLLAHPNVHPYDSDLILTDKNNVVTEINKKNSVRDFYYKNLVNSGIFILSPTVLEYFDCVKKVNLEHDLVNSYIEKNKVYAYRSTEYVKDVGTPERLAAAVRDVASGVVGKKNLENKQKAIFLDRDGTLNVFKDFITSADDIELISGVPDAVKAINSSGYLAIVVSNQPVIARGECTFDDVNEMFDKIETLLGKEGAYLDGIYYCPHHPDSGFDGEVKSLKIKCDCRKPNIGLIKAAEKDFNLDLSLCAIVGDSKNDVLTGKNAGLKTVLVKSGISQTIDLKPDHIAEDLSGAVEYLLNNSK